MTLEGSVAELHAAAWPEPVLRTVWHMAPARSALVLGSTQRDLAAVLATPAAAAGLDVVVRASGGGAVLVDPSSMVWIDVVLPRSDPLWMDDVGRSGDWLGRVWADALERLGMPTQVHEGPFDPGRWGSLVCFAGAAAGEVHARGVAVGRRGGKVVGISQRRTRHGVRFQSMLHLDVDAPRLVEVLRGAVDPGDLDELREAVAASVAVVEVAGERVSTAFMEALTARTT